MNEADRLVVALSLKIIIIHSAIALIGVFLTNNKSAFLLGIGVGTVTTIGRLALIEHSLNQALSKPEHSAANHIRLAYIIRYGTTFVILMVGALVPAISLVGVILSLISLKPATYWQTLTLPQSTDSEVEYVEWEEEDEEEKSDFW